jgi:hypothetical protein
MCGAVEFSFQLLAKLCLVWVWSGLLSICALLAGNRSAEDIYVRPACGKRIVGDAHALRCEVSMAIVVQGEL